MAKSSAAAELPSISNAPVWNTLSGRDQAGFQEAWYFKANDLPAQRALWIRFAIHSSTNGFKRTAEIIAILSQRNENRDVIKSVLRQSFDIGAFSVLPSGAIRIGENELGKEGTRGMIQSKGQTLRWDLSITEARKAEFNFVPQSLTRIGMAGSTAVTPGEDLIFNGTTELNSESHSWSTAPGMQGHFAGPEFGYSWIWGHCNTFTNEQGKPVPFVFEGLSARARLVGRVPFPRLSSFFFLYQEKEYHFNSLWHAALNRSSHTLTEWKFQVDKGDLSFRGQIKGEHRDFAGINYEDSDGSLLYSSNTQFAQMRLMVYRRGKLETTVISTGNATLELVSRQKNPYVPILL